TTARSSAPDRTTTIGLGASGGRCAIAASSTTQVAQPPGTTTNLPATARGNIRSHTARPAAWVNIKPEPAGPVPDPLASPSLGVPPTHPPRRAGTTGSRTAMTGAGSADAASSGGNLCKKMSNDRPPTVGAALGP